MQSEILLNPPRCTKQHNFKNLPTKYISDRFTANSQLIVIHVQNQHI